MARGGEHLAPRGDHILVGNRAIVEGEHAPRVVERVEPCQPSSALPAQREGELSPVTPWKGTRSHARRFDVSAANAPYRVTNDLPFRAKLRLVPKVLELAAPTSIYHVMRAGGRNAEGGCHTELAEFHPRKTSLGRHIDNPDVARGGPGNENDAAIDTPHAVASRGDRLDPHLGAKDHRGRNPSRLAVRSHASSLGRRAWSTGEVAEAAAPLI